jgi:hypothetical protein
VKLVNTLTQRAALVAFLRSGETGFVTVPVGTYELRLASGATWYGEVYLFGPQTVYSKADDQLTFSIEGDQAVGHRIELQKQLNGNLKETEIRPSDF